MLNKKRLLEIFEAVHNAKVSNELTLLCKGELLIELGINQEYIDKVIIEGASNQDEQVVLARKRIKAVMTVLRGRVNELALQYGVIKEGLALPKVGYWANASNTFAGVGKTGMLNYLNAEGKKVFTDPLSNPDFVRLVLSEK
jgi:hypothetical protein